MEEAHTYKREKYLNLTKELRDAGYRAVLMAVEVSARGFIGSSVYDLLTKLSMNKRTKALKLLGEIKSLESFLKILLHCAYPQKAIRRHSISAKLCKISRI